MGGRRWGLWFDSSRFCDILVDLWRANIMLHEAMGGWMGFFMFVQIACMYERYLKTLFL